MLIDSSGLVAIVLNEDDAPKIVAALETSEFVYVTPIVIYEAAMAVARVRVMSLERATDIVQQFCQALNANCIAIGEDMAIEALGAASRFGKGRHKAQLNMGDCFSYAAAKTLAVPLLFKGDDFSLTDIMQAKTL